MADSLTTPPSSDDAPSPDSPGLDAVANPLDAELSLPKAVEATGVSDKTLRRWIKDGHVQARLVESPTGSQWIVSIRDVRVLARQKGIGHFRAAEPEVESNSQLIALVQEWTQDRTELTNQLRQSEEGRGRAEAKVEVMKERFGDLRADRDEWKERARQLEERMLEQPAKRRWFRRRGK